MLKTNLRILLAISLFGVGDAIAAPPVPGETTLEHALRGRVAGRPVNCINLRHSRSTRIITHSAIIFETGSTLYVNRPLAGAESLSDSNALLIKSLTGEICRGEGIRLFDNTSRIETGVIFLGQFVPYRKATTGGYAPVGGGSRSYR